MMFLMMLPLSCLAASNKFRPVPEDLINNADFKRMKLFFGADETDLRFEPSSYSHSTDVDAYKIADYGWHECVGGLPTFIEKWYAGEQDYAAFLEKATTGWTEYAFHQHRHFCDGRIFEKYSDDGKTAYLFLRRSTEDVSAQPTRWVVEEYHYSKMSVDAVMCPVKTPYSLYKSTQCYITDATLGRGGFEPHTFETSLNHRSNEKSQRVNLVIYPYKNDWEKERVNEGRVKGDEYTSMYDRNDADIYARGKKKFTAGLQRKQAQDEMTKTVLLKYLVSEFKKKAESPEKPPKEVMSHFKDRCSEIMKELFVRQYRNGTIVTLNEIQEKKGETEWTPTEKNKDALRADIMMMGTRKEGHRFWQSFCGAGLRYNGEAFRIVPNPKYGIDFDFDLRITRENVWLLRNKAKVAANNVCRRLSNSMKPKEPEEQKMAEEHGNKRSSAIMKKDAAQKKKENTVMNAVAGMTQKQKLAMLQMIKDSMEC